MYVKDVEVVDSALHIFYSKLTLTLFKFLHIRFDALFFHAHYFICQIYLYGRSLLKGDTAQHKMLPVARSMKSFKQKSIYHLQAFVRENK